MPHSNVHSQHHVSGPKFSYNQVNSGVMSTLWRTACAVIWFQPGNEWLSLSRTHITSGSGKRFLCQYIRLTSVHNIVSELSHCAEELSESSSVSNERRRTLIKVMSQLIVHLQFQKHCYSVLQDSAHMLIKQLIAVSSQSLTQPTERLCRDVQKDDRHKIIQIRHSGCH